MAARPMPRRLAILTVVVGALAAACAPVTAPPPAPPPPAAQSAPPPPPPPPPPAACTSTTEVPTPSNPVEYVAVVDDGDGDAEVETFTATSAAERDLHVAALDARGGVVAVEEDLPVYAQVSMDDEPFVPEQWGLAAAGLPGAWAAGYDGAGQVIAIVDSGVASGHPEFAGRLRPGHFFLGDLEGDGAEDDHGHGTHVAGIAAAGDNGEYGLGAAPQAEILPVKVLNDQGSGAFSDVAEGIDWAVAQGADVINLSLGAPYPSCSAAIQQEIDEANAKGVVVVAAAGNDGSDRIGAPGGSTGVITVGATTSTGDKAPYSNHGPFVDIGAPGSGVLSTLPANGFGSKSGTSMATPFIAGTVALLRQKCGDVSWGQALNILRTHAGPMVPGLGAPRLAADLAVANAC